MNIKVRIGGGVDVYTEYNIDLTRICTRREETEVPSENDYKGSELCENRKGGRGTGVKDERSYYRQEESK